MKLLIVIPAYNEGENIERVVDNLINNTVEICLYNKKYSKKRIAIF